MDRKIARQRREYLFNKSLMEKKEKQDSKDFILDESNAAIQKPALDDEYAQAGTYDPKILITTSRDPSSKLTQFVKELKLIFPTSQRINRGGYLIPDLVQACLKNNATDLIICHETRGNPDTLVVSHLPHGPTAYFTLHNVVTRHEVPNIGKMSEQYPHLIFDQFQSKLGLRVQSILKYLFPVPKPDSTRIITFRNESDFISFRHHVYHKKEGEIELSEVGPRFEMQIYEIKLGTIGVPEAESEWVYRPYQRTARKREIL